MRNAGLHPFVRVKRTDHGFVGSRACKWMASLNLKADFKINAYNKFVYLFNLLLCMLSSFLNLPKYFPFKSEGSMKIINPHTHSDLTCLYLFMVVSVPIHLPETTAMLRSAPVAARALYE